MTKLSTERQIKAKPKKKKKLTTITEEKNPGGRPPIYTNPEEMESKAEEYFSKCDTGEEIEVLAKNGTVVKITKKIPYTVPGLSHHLGFATRKGVFDYKQKGEFRNTITRALQRIERQRNEKALTGEQEPRFAQFDLKNNFGWKDQQNVQVDAEIKHGVSDDLQALIEDIVA